MKCPSGCCGWRPQPNSSMIHQAKEELLILEAQHPNRFEYLKLELKSFISSLESQNDDNLYHCMPSSSSTTTQVSSTIKKRRTKGKHDVRRMEVGNVETCSDKVERADGEDHIPKKRRVDEVIERAQACLHKIQLFKTSFLLDSSGGK